MKNIRKKCNKKELFIGCEYFFCPGDALNNHKKTTKRKLQGDFMELVTQ